MSKQKGHTEHRQRYRNRRYSCNDRHKRTYNFYQYENYLKHCRSWGCEVLQRDRGPVVKHRTIRFSGD